MNERQLKPEKARLLCRLGLPVECRYRPPGRTASSVRDGRWYDVPVSWMKSRNWDPFPYDFRLKP